VVPRAGLRGNNQVYIANEDETLDVRTVTVRASDRDRAIITAGLNPGEQVVISPIRGAATGMQINIVDVLAENTALPPTATE